MLHTHATQSRLAAFATVSLPIDIFSTALRRHLFCAVETLSFRLPIHKLFRSGLSHDEESDIAATYRRRTPRRRARPRYFKNSARCRPCAVLRHYHSCCCSILFQHVFLRRLMALRRLFRYARVMLGSTPPPSLLSTRRPRLILFADTAGRQQRSHAQTPPTRTLLISPWFET